MKKLMFSLVVVGFVLSGCALSNQRSSDNLDEPSQPLEIFSFLDSSPDEFKAEAQRSCELLPSASGKPNLEAARGIRVGIAKRAALVVGEIRKNSSFDLLFQ